MCRDFKVIEMKNYKTPRLLRDGKFQYIPTRTERTWNRALAFACIIAVAYWLAGCATITTGTNQTITVETDKPCELRSGRDSTTVTPERKTVLVAKSNRDIVVDCGETNVATIKPEVSSAGLMSVLWLDFGIVDTLSGAMWQYPEHVDMRVAP